ncbi:MAG: phosphoglycerate dehydrogenase [Pirellulales bacterium]|nr:phosphoglycerate dehydrogenase [Pirellulales bacterium]
MPTDVALIDPEHMIGVDAEYVSILQDAGFEVIYPDDRTFSRGLHSEEATIDQLSKCNAVLAGGPVFTPNVLANLPDLRVIARSGVGYDRVDIPAATQHNIAVCITPNANHESVAEHAMMLLLGIAKGVLVNDEHSRAARWPQSETLPVRGTTVGIIGLGRIGRSFAVRAIGMGMKVIATELYPNTEFVEQHGIELVDREALLSRSDYISVHCPFNDDTKGMINAQFLSQMKPGAVIINTARGGLQVEADLVDALKSGHLYGAGLDVFEEEPPAAGNALFDLPNVILSPHIGSGDSLSRLMMGVEAAQCIASLRHGHWPEGAVVNSELRDGWQW